LDFHNTIATYKNSLGVQELAFIAFGGFLNLFSTPSTLEGHKFFNYIYIFTIFSAPKALIKGVQVVFGHQK